MKKMHEKEPSGTLAWIGALALLVAVVLLASAAWGKPAGSYSRASDLFIMAYVLLSWSQLATKTNTLIDYVGILGSDAVKVDGKVAVVIGEDGQAVVNYEHLYKSLLARAKVLEEHVVSVSHRVSTFEERIVADLQGTVDELERTRGQLDVWKTRCLEAEESLVSMLEDAKSGKILN